MNKQIIKIDQEKCVGCGLCANTCHQGAIGIVDGKAKLLSEDHCDGLGRCLPVCPTGAITFEDKDVELNVDKDDESVCTPDSAEDKNDKLPCGCPSTHAKTLARARVIPKTTSYPAEEFVSTQESMLAQWPCQIKLVPVNAPYFDGANLLVSADCSAYAYHNYHDKFMRNRVTLIGCPKLDAGDYAEKLTHIIANNNIESVTVTRMEVPCCGGLESAVVNALKNSCKMIPWQVVTISTDGRIIER